MLEFLKNIFASDFLPHGHCYFWKPELVWLHVTSDSLIMLAYYSIPLTLLYLVRKRQDLAFHWMFLMFGAFIFACGTTHLMDVWTLWIPMYRLQGVIKLVTAALSVATALMLVPLIPKVLAVPSPAALELANQELIKQVNERQKAVVALQASEERFRLAIEGVKDYAIFTLDPQGYVTSWNIGAERIKGYRSAEILGTHFSCFYSREDNDSGKPQRQLQIAAAEGRAEDEGWRVRKDGSRFWAHVVMTALRDANGQLRGFSKVTRDITERRRVQEALAESEARYRAVSELTSDYAYSFRVEPDVGVAVEWVAGAFARITGFTPEEVAARGGGLSLVHPDDLPVAQRRLATLFSGQPDTSDLRIVTKSGEIRWVRESGHAVWDEAHQQLRVFAATQDITARKRAEEVARQHREELAHVLRVSTVGEMAAGLAHEINQPLSAIISYAKGCVRRMQALPQIPKELIDTIEQMAAQAVRADQIVRHLRSLVRRHEPRRDVVGLNDVVRGVANLMNAAATERGVVLQLDLDPDLPLAHLDRIQIEQVILNLVRNGLEAMGTAAPEDCVLSIRTTMAGPSTFEVAVCDSGVGLTKATAEQLFEPFFTTKPDGLGMGLSISRSIIEAHGGRLWATANQSRGVTFRFTIPVSNAEHSEIA